jgi:hypothetical protein
MKAIALILVTMISCTGNKLSTEHQTLDFRSFTIEAPASWTKINMRGIDSYIGKIALPLNDTLSFDLGWYSYNLSQNAEKNTITWETIDGRNAKIVYPKQSGNGTTGIYIDSLWREGAVSVDKFNLYGVNLEPANEKVLLQALKTLKFYENK